MGEVAPREAGRCQNKLRHRLVPGQCSNHWGAEAPDTALLLHLPFWIPFQFHLHQPSARSISSCMSQTVSPQRGSSPTQVPMDFAATSGTTATWKLLLGKVTRPPSLNGSGPLGNCADRQRATPLPFTEHPSTTGSGPR